MYRYPLVDINNINVPEQRICSHFLVQIPRADAEIITPDFRKLISREIWYILFVWSFSVMRFLRPLLKHLTQLVNFITCDCESSAPFFVIVKLFFWTTVMRIVQLMTDRWRYFNPSKNYWFSFSAFLGSGWLNWVRLLDLTAHTSLSPIRRGVKIISTKWFMHISHLISVNIFLENFDTFCLFDLLV
jgi:hypothetical protein